MGTRVGQRVNAVFTFAAQNRRVDPTRGISACAIVDLGQRQTQVLEVPVWRMISAVPTPSALSSTMAARQTCF
jgi:hypothetical protein